MKSLQQYTGKEKDKMITISLCRKFCPAYLGTEDTTVKTQRLRSFRYMRDSKYGARSHIKKMSNTMFAHMVVGVYRNLPKTER